MSQPPKTRSLSGASGTNSRIVGDRDSVRLPSLTVPISVREPIGLARPLRTAMTPAIVVVLTAPRPTRRMPSLPSAGAIERPVVTVGNYIIQDRAVPAGPGRSRPHTKNVQFPPPQSAAVPDATRDDRRQARGPGAVLRHTRSGARGGGRARHRPERRDVRHRRCKDQA